MADLRIAPSPPRSPEANLPARSQAARAAQAAFFQAALARPELPVAPLRPVAAARPPAEATASGVGTSTTAQAPPDRILRPGSLVDLRV